MNPRYCLPASFLLATLSAHAATEFGHTPETSVLLVNHAKKEDNFALSKANEDGTFTVICKDNGSNTSAYEQAPSHLLLCPWTRWALVA